MATLEPAYIFQWGGAQAEPCDASHPCLSRTLAWTESAATPTAAAAIRTTAQRAARPPARSPDWNLRATVRRSGLRRAGLELLRWDLPRTERCYFTDASECASGRCVGRRVLRVG